MSALSIYAWAHLIGMLVCYATVRWTGWWFGWSFGKKDLRWSLRPDGFPLWFFAYTWYVWVVAIPLLAVVFWTADACKDARGWWRYR